MLKACLFAVLAALALGQTPSPPQYPPVFSVQFFETQLTAASNSTTYGQNFYDSTRGLLRQDRFSGLTDVMCATGLPMTSDTMCSHLVINDMRYLYYPALNSCCYCCNSTDGCGALNQTWLTGAQYVGTDIIYGTQAYVWNQSNNFYYETAVPTPTQRTPLGLFREQPGLLDYFEYLTFAPYNPITAFVLPNECASPPLCGGICPIFRGPSTTPVEL